MLVLSRKPGQSIVLNDDIIITVVAVGGGRAQLGITAPFHVPVHREEVHRRVQTEAPLLSAKLATAKA